MLAFGCKLGKNRRAGIETVTKTISTVLLANPSGFRWNIGGVSILSQIFAFKIYVFDDSTLESEAVRG